MQKYKHLGSCHFFTSVAIETTGVFGPRTTEFFKELSHGLRQVSGEANSFAYLTQRLSVAIQRGNAASILGTMKVDSEDKEFFVYIFCYYYYYLFFFCGAKHYYTYLHHYNMKLLMSIYKIN